ncbi:hypothetical protein WI77_14240 [Burkholderia ubonensis]|nr:hypothetical protein WI77_14240 [Burkholderia ubonensis]
MVSIAAIGDILQTGHVEARPEMRFGSIQVVVKTSVCSYKQSSSMNCMSDLISKTSRILRGYIFLSLVI